MLEWLELVSAVFVGTLGANLGLGTLVQWINTRKRDAQLRRLEEMSAEYFAQQAAAATKETSGS